MRPVILILGFLLAHTASGAPVTTRTFNDWTRHFGFSFGTNLVASFNAKGFQVASLPPDRSVLQLVPLPPDCSQDSTPGFEWMEAGFATVLCNQKPYLFDLRAGSVAALAAGAIRPVDIDSAFQEDSVILDRGDGKYDFFGWAGSAITHSYLRLDTHTRVISEVSLGEKGSPIQAVPHTHTWHKLDEDSKLAL